MYFTKVELKKKIIQLLSLEFSKLAVQQVRSSGLAKDVNHA